jgi:peptide/nickel transport system ATP-binding protein
MSAEEVEAVSTEGLEPICVVTNGRRVFERRSILRSAPPVVAVDDVSFDVMPGESVGLVGESGSGKTTIARCLLGLERLTAGRAEIAGIDISDPRALSRSDRRGWRQAVQLVFQDPYSSLNPARTIGWTLREAIGCRADADAADDVDAEIAALLELVGLSASYAARVPRALSGGQRQRVAIARALAVKPRLIVCDEPVSALDVSVQAEILALFRRLQSELDLAYLFITHDLAVLRQVADRAYVMQHGRVVEEGPLDVLLENPEHPYTQRLIAATPRPDHDWLERADRASSVLVDDRPPTAS